MHFSFSWLTAGPVNKYLVIVGLVCKYNSLFLTRVDSVNIILIYSAGSGSINAIFFFTQLGLVP